MIGQQFGKWTVKDFERLTGCKPKWICECECKYIGRLVTADLLRGKSTQCVNCYNKNRKAHNKRHNLSDTSIYKAWRSIKYRCLVDTCKDYKFYGARGITISDDWLIFENFYRDMGDRPDGKQIDRIDNNLGYFKDNCRWVTPKENCNNRRRSGPIPKCDRS